MQPLPEALLGSLLRQKKWQFASAESCTGGLIGHRITNIPGSSEYYRGGIVAYAYEAKVALLGVRWETLNAHGAVSRQTVLEMAAGACRALGADLAVSVSGIAGPGGGLLNKPVGTTWIGLASPAGLRARVFVFSGDRESNKASSAEAALQMAITCLQRGLEAIPDMPDEPQRF